MNTDAPLRLSWRDPDGFVVRVHDRVLRAVSPAVAANVDAVLRSRWYRALVAEGHASSAEWLDDVPPAVSGQGDFRWLEHRALIRPVYPHEITALQLYDAAKLTLRVARDALADGWQLKDASAWNVLFERGKPVFCDLLSFERPDGTAIWRAYAQFCRHFLIPLLLHRKLGIQPAPVFVTHRDGVAPETARPMLRGVSAYLQPALEAVTLPSALARRARRPSAAGDEAPPAVRRADLAAHLMGRTFARLERHIDALEPRFEQSRGIWSDYEHDRAHYGEEDLAAKRDFVSHALRRPGIDSVLDIGCNAGEYSLLAAQNGKSVLAADSDQGALTKLYANVRLQSRDVTPVVLDIARPTPAVGWMNAEIPGFIDRVAGHVDCVMALGLLHHLLVTERATLEMIRDLFRALEAPVLIVEWIEPRDPRFRGIARFDAALYEHLDRACFERVFAERYVMIDSCALAGGARVLYAWQATGA